MVDRAGLPMHTDRNAVQFVLDGAVVQVAAASPTLTVLEYLRDSLGRVGSKEGCAEGDCGACTVVLGELAPAGDRIEYRAINSCIRLLPTIDGQELVTVESLQGADSSLHPVQQAMVDNHASQCGFCTPGFVMSLFALYLQQDAVRRDDVVNALQGNLCRCTGYRPIIAAGCAMNDYTEPAHWSRRDAQSAARATQLRTLREAQPLSLQGFSAPRNLDELAAILAAAPESLILAGGTDIGLWVTKQLRELPPLVYIGGIGQLKQIRMHAAGLEIGAAVTLAEAWRAIVALYPELRELALRFASPPVCNSGTLCGNLANGSPVGDSMPALIALGAQLELRHGAQTRQLPLEQLYLGYQRKAFAPGEFIVSVTLPHPRPQQRVAGYKVSKRFDQDIAAVCAAFALQLDGKQISDARIAFGGMAAIPARARHAEAALIGKEWGQPALEAAVSALASDFQPLTDLRASGEYRLLVAANLLRRFFLETHGTASVLRITDLPATCGSSD